MQPFILTHNQFNRLRESGYYCEVVDSDSELVAGYVDRITFNHYFLGEDITNRDLSQVEDFWMDRNGHMYQVPCAGHAMVAYVCFGRSGDNLEQNGWIHFSGCKVTNYYPLETNEAMYNQLRHYYNQRGHENIPDYVINCLYV